MTSWPLLMLHHRDEALILCIRRNRIAKTLISWFDGRGDCLLRRRNQFAVERERERSKSVTPSWTERKGVGGGKAVRAVLVVALKVTTSRQARHWKPGPRTSSATTYFTYTYGVFYVITHLIDSAVYFGMLFRLSVLAQIDPTYKQTYACKF